MGKSFRFAAQFIIRLLSCFSSLLHAPFPPLGGEGGVIELCPSNNCSLISFRLRFPHWGRREVHTALFMFMTCIAPLLPTGGEGRLEQLCSHQPCFLSLLCASSPHWGRREVNDCVHNDIDCFVIACSFPSLSMERREITVCISWQLLSLSHALPLLSSERRGAYSIN